MWILYRCDKIKRFQLPQNEVEISRHQTSDEAWAEAARLRAIDNSFSYILGKE